MRRMGHSDAGSLAMAGGTKEYDGWRGQRERVMTRGTGSDCPVLRRPQKGGNATNHHQTHRLSLNMNRLHRVCVRIFSLNRLCIDLKR